MKRNKSKLWIVVIVLVLVAAGFYVANKMGTVEIDNSGAPTVKVDSDEEKKKDEIRRREDIQKQQELLVQETYLKEKKDATEKEKADAIAKYDSDLAQIETQLEAVRGQQVSFQSPQKQ